ncbi:hypothetical protein RAA17_06870 [Komagataeibacter rhaeticus]|nr:hypothetical protein [Komagataeibacter rhaeticus]
MTYRAAVLGTAPRIGIEAASGFGWERWLGADGIFVGIDGFGASPDQPGSPADITPERICRDAMRLLAPCPTPCLEPREETARLHPEWHRSMPVCEHV